MLSSLCFEVYEAKRVNCVIVSIIIFISFTFILFQALPFCLCLSQHSDYISICHCLVYNQLQYQPSLLNLSVVNVAFESCLCQTKEYKIVIV